MLLWSQIETETALITNTWLLLTVNTQYYWHIIISVILVRAASVHIKLNVKPSDNNWCIKDRKQTKLPKVLSLLSLSFGCFSWVSVEDVGGTLVEDGGDSVEGRVVVLWVVVVDVVVDDTDDEDVADVVWNDGVPDVCVQDKFVVTLKKQQPQLNSRVFRFLWIHTHSDW